MACAICLDRQAHDLSVIANIAYGVTAMHSIRLQLSETFDEQRMRAVLRKDQHLLARRERDCGEHSAAAEHLAPVQRQRLASGVLSHSHRIESRAAGRMDPDGTGAVVACGPPLVHGHIDPLLSQKAGQEKADGSAAYDRDLMIRHLAPHTAARAAREGRYSPASRWG